MPMVPVLYCCHCGRFSASCLKLPDTATLGSSQIDMTIFDHSSCGQKCEVAFVLGDSVEIPEANLSACAVLREGLDVSEVAANTDAGVAIFPRAWKLSVSSDWIGATVKVTSGPPGTLFGSILANRLLPDTQMFARRMKLLAAAIDTQPGRKRTRARHALDGTVVFATETVPRAGRSIEVLEFSRQATVRSVSDAEVRARGFSTEVVEWLRSGGAAELPRWVASAAASPSDEMSGDPRVPSEALRGDPMEIMPLLAEAIVRDEARMEFNVNWVMDNAGPISNGIVPASLPGRVFIDIQHILEQEGPLNWR